MYLINVYMNLFATVFSTLFLFSSMTHAVAPDTGCGLPFSMATRIVTIKAVPSPFAPPAPQLSGIPHAAAESTTTASSVAAAMSLFSAYSPTQVAQGPRALLAFQMLSCSNASSLEQELLPWTSSPTRLSIGNSALSDHLGAVVGNWALLAGTASLWTLTAAKLGTEKSRFPGGLVWPVLFLTSPTLSSATTLVREGTWSEQLVGGCSVTIQAIGAGVIAVFLHPKNFKAEWISETFWEDGSSPGYVKRYGMLFQNFREGRHWFLTAELLMSMATGLLDSYQEEGSDCQSVVAASAMVSITYALSMAVLRPHQLPMERKFYAGIAGLQALALTTQAISLWGASEETQTKIRTVTESVIMATQWALALKSLFDLGKRAKSFYSEHVASSTKAHTDFTDYLVNGAELGEQ